MSSGGSRVVVNERERAVSPDLNRLQSLHSRDLAEILRYLCENRPNFGTGAGGIESSPGTLDSPLRALVIAGLRVRPDVGTVNTFIERGVLVAASPDAVPDPDDSPYRYVVDEGVQIAGALTFTPNGGGGIRVDVVECQVIEELVETDSRDVFNIGTGTFSPALVEKVRRRRLEYRIRLGTVGAGFPGAASGWLPLAVVTAPAGAATWDDCIVWDVRPLLSDLEFAPTRLVRNFATRYREFVSTEPDALPAPSTELRLTGEVEIGFAGFICGGTLDQDADIGWIDILNTDNQDPVAGAFVASAPWYLWACYPHGLPRWCRYTPASSGSRVPGPFRGIPCVSFRAPSSMTGLPALPGVRPPTVTGLTTSTLTAVLICAGLTSPDPAEPFGVEVDGHITRLVFFPGTASVTIAPTTNDVNFAEYSIVDSTNVPPSARAIWVRFTGNFTAMAIGGRLNHVITQRDVGNTYELLRQILPPSTPGSAVDPGPDLVNYQFDIRLPYQSTLGNLATHTRVVRWTHNGGAVGAGVGASSLQVLGWELGP
jgi:hypothetical protein